MANIDALIGQTISQYYILGRLGRWRDGSGVQADDTRLDRQKHMSQGQIEEKTGLLRCYISRIENGHTVPTIETLEKLARAM
jgi:hypothetical protein